MKLDLIILGVLALFGVMGLASGAVKQLSHWTGLILGYGAARPLASALAPHAAQSLGWPPILLNIMLSCLLFVLLAAMGTAAAHFLFARLLKDRQNGAGNRAFGFVLGAGKAAAGIFVALSALLFFEKPFAQVGGAFDSQTKDSAVVAFVRSHNLFASLHMPALSGIQRILGAQKDPQAVQALLNDPRIKTLLDDPRLKDLLTDRSVKKAMESGDLAALHDIPKIKELLNDPELAEQLSRIKGL